MKPNQVMEVAIRAGEIVLRNGSEIGRVECTIRKIIEAYKMQCEVFVLATGIFVTLTFEDATPITRIKRIESRSTHLGRLEEINHFSRAITLMPIEYEQAMSMLDEIEQIKSYSLPFQMFAASGLSFVFSFFFDATLFESSIAALFAGIIHFVWSTLVVKISFPFFEYFTVAFLSVCLCALASNLFPQLELLKLIIGVMMIMLPGNTIAAGMKEAINGDILSSLYKFSEAVFILVAIAAGTALPLSVFGR